MYETLKADEEDPDECYAENIFFVPEDARWTYIQIRAKDPTIGVLIDTAMRSVEGNNARLKDLLPQNYGREAFYKLCRMTLEIRGINSSNIRYGDTFHNDPYPDLKADYILANQPFNISDWGGQLLEEDSHW